MPATRKFDARQYLENHIPSFFLLLGGNTLDWKTVNKRFVQTFEKYLARYERTNTTFRIEASLFNIIDQAGKRDPEAIRNFEYLQTLFTRLTMITGPEEKKELKDTLFGLLTNANMKYLNFVGELSVLYFLKQKEPLTLLQTERPINPDDPEGIKIDFHLRHRDTSHEGLVEVVNLSVNDKNTASDDFIERLLDQKINGKLLATGIREYKTFTLIPVLWGKWDHVHVIASYYKRKQPTFENTWIPLSFVPFTDQDGTSVYKFEQIDTLFLGSAVG